MLYILVYIKYILFKLYVCYFSNMAHNLHLLDSTYLITHGDGALGLNPKRSWIPPPVQWVLGPQIVICHRVK